MIVRVRVCVHVPTTVSGAVRSRAWGRQGCRERGPPRACRAHVGSTKVPEKPTPILSQGPCGLPAGWFREEERRAVGTGAATRKTGPPAPRPLLPAQCWS